jgi:L-amino acid N-acyltransferase
LSAIAVRAATLDDLTAIREIYNHAVLHTTATADHDPQTLEARHKWFEERTAQELPVIVAVAEGEVVGWGALNRYHSRYGYRFTVENSVYVAESWRGRGVGRVLLAELVAAARRLKFHAIIAALDGENAVSRALHERFGFVEVGRMREVMHKFDRWLDVLYLELLL